MKRIRTRTLQGLTAGLLLSGSVTLAQGSDDCSSAQPIAGTGFFDFSLPSGTNTDGFPEGLYGNPGVGQIYHDKWYSWAAPTTGAYVISTDHVQNEPGGIWACIAVYRYGCAAGQGRALSARAPLTGVHSTVVLGAEAGVTYLIRIGHVNDTLSGGGVFSIDPTSSPGVLGSAVNPANGRTYHILEPSSWHVAQAAAQGLGGNLVTVNDQAENDWLLQTFGSFGGESRSFWIGYNDAETEGVWEWVSGETPGYENWSGGTGPNNGNQYEHYAHFRHDWTDGSWNDLIGDPNVAFFYDEVHGLVEVAELGSGYCIAATNSTGSASSISASGSASVSANDLVLSANNLPAQPGIFIAGPTQTQIPFFNGFLCIDPNGLQRFSSVASPVGGTITEAVDYATASQGGLNVVAGASYNYQRWNRDPAAGGGNANFSNALEIAHTP